jgi:hypothetical protein
MYKILKLQPISNHLYLKINILRGMMYCGILWGLYNAEQQGWAMTSDHDDYVFHQEIHLGDFCLAQRKRVYDFTRQLDENQRVDFYETYNGELRRIADDDPAHPADAENGVGAFAIMIALGVIALVLYFAVIRSIVG